MLALHAPVLLLQALIAADGYGVVTARWWSPSAGHLRDYPSPLQAFLKGTRQHFIHSTLGQALALLSRLLRRSLL
jgi:hypothetical protein